MSKRGGINRAFSWIKKVLEVTEVTTVPERILPEVLATADLFGWERLTEAIATVTSGKDIAVITSPGVPNDTIRLVLGASVRTSNAVAALSIWLEHQTRSGAIIGIVRPFITLVGTGTPQRVGTSRPFLMSPGDILFARASAAVGVGETLVIEQRFIDLPVGEYIPHV